MYTKTLFKNTKVFQFRALDFDLAHKNEINRFGCTTRNRLCSQKQLKKCQKHYSFRRFVPPKRRRDAMRCATAGRPNVWFHFKAHFCTCFWRFFLYLWPGTWRVLIQWRAELPMCPKSCSATASKLPDTWPGAEKYIKKACVFDDLIWNHTFERQMPRSVSFDAHDLGGANRRKASCF